MGRFLAVFAIFLLAHAVPAMPAIRQSLRARLGSVGYLLAYSALSLLLFTWLISEVLRAPYVPLWFIGPAGHAVALVVLPFAFALLGASALAPNDLSVNLVGQPFDPVRPGPVAISRHPILWGLGLWGLGHVPANGHAVGLILFGGLGAFALIGMLVLDRRKRAVLGTPRWQALAAPTSFLPFGALLAGRTRLALDRTALIGAAAGLAGAVVLLSGLHRWLFGKDPLAYFLPF